jgi:hypothetical protein
VAINHKDGSQLQVVYNDPVYGPVYLTDVFGNSKDWIDKRIQELTKRWVDPGIGQVLGPETSLAINCLIRLHFR